MSRMRMTSFVFLLLSTAAFAQTVISIDWSKSVRISRTTPTLQEVCNPLMDRTAAQHDSALATLKRIGANYTRFQGWGDIGVGYSIFEPQAPSGGKTYWDFSHIDPLVIDFMSAQEGRPVLLDFSSYPGWMLTPDCLQALDPTYKPIADYFARLLSWYEKGGFTDELGVVHNSGYSYKFDYWEVFNEPEMECDQTKEEYVKRYDVIVAALLKVDPNLKFAGPALSTFDSSYYGYLYAQMSLAGQDIVGMSALITNPGNYPDVSMVDWNNGRPNARARVLELLTHYTGPGDNIVTASASTSSVFAIAFIAAAGEHKALVVNRTSGSVTLSFPQNVTDVKYVDVTTNGNPVATRAGVGVKQLSMNGYAVWVATLEGGSVPVARASGGPPRVARTDEFPPDDPPA